MMLVIYFSTRRISKIQKLDLMKISEEYSAKYLEIMQKLDLMEISEEYLEIMQKLNKNYQKAIMEHQDITVAKYVEEKNVLID